jgi:hypothetical protein
MFIRIIPVSMSLSESADMNLGGQRLMPDITQRGVAAPPPMQSAPVDLERLLPLGEIRTHTKTDDVPHVTDNQLRLYRKAAFEACEKYTGRIFSELRVITESVSQRRTRRMRPFYIHELKHPSFDGIVYLYGTPYGAGDRRIDIGPGGRQLRLEVTNGAIDASSCCGGPCDGDQYNYGMKAMYRAGVDCAENVPAGIILGVLKFIAWAISNPGDEIMTVRNREAGQSDGIVGTNNGAWASGAIEQWRIYVDDAV